MKNIYGSEEIVAMDRHQLLVLSLKFIGLNEAAPTESVFVRTCVLSIHVTYVHRDMQLWEHLRLVTV